MTKVSVYNQKGDKTGEQELNSSIFGVQPSIELIQEAVRIQLSNKRSPIADAKDRSEQRGGGRKPWKQKGTGRARAGSNRSPIWRGGGVTFGPNRNQNFALSMNKKAKRKALFMVLADKVNNENLLIIEDIKLENTKTKEAAQMLKSFFEALKKDFRKILIVLPQNQYNSLDRSFKNIPNIKLINADSLNIYDILDSDELLVLKEAVPVIENTYLPTQSKN